MGKVTTASVPVTPAGPTPPPAPAPEKILGKFENQAALEAAYTELEKQFHASKTPSATPPATPPATTPDAPATPPTTPEATPVLPDRPDVVGLDAYEAEYAESGKLSDESYKKLADAGHSKADVDKYIQGRIAVRDATEADLFSVVGGKDQFTAMAKWSASGMTTEERANFNKAMNAGDPYFAKLAMADLKTRFEAAHGKTPNLVRGTSAAPSGDEPFASDNEFYKAMADPKYKTDSDYRDRVMRRAQASLK